MKKIFSLLFVSALYLQGNAQTLKASIGPGSLPNRIKIYLMPDATQASTISTLQFNVGIAATGITTAPTLTLISQAAGFNSAAWQISSSYNEGGYYNYNIFTASSPLTPSFTMNTELEAMELEFSNGAPEAGTVGLVTLPDGGTTTANALFLCTGSITSNGLGNLYYARAGVTVDNQNSYDPNFVVAGTATSIATIPSVVLPVRFLNFTAVRSNNTALLNWSVESEDANTATYEIEKSVNGADFTGIKILPALNNGRSSNVYAYTVENLSAIRSSGIIYFRIKQTDKDGRFVYTPIKSVRLDRKGLIVGVYPNPVRNIANVSFDMESASEVIISLTDAAGKQVLTTQVQGFKGANINKLNVAKLASGNYTLKVQAGAEVKVMPLVKAD